MDTKRSILVLGGSKFMGRALVKRFNREGWKVTTFNRGRCHWKPCIDPSVERINGDREEDEEFRTFLKSRTWDVVVDFISFDSADIRQIVDCLVGRVNHYILISSDSTYEVCPANCDLDFEAVNAQDKLRREAQVKQSFWDLIHPAQNGKWPPRTEELAVRPKSRELRKMLKKKDSYAHGKLKCEEKLCEAWDQHKFPWTAVRLPDVMGPFDHTKRHWRYQLLAQKDCCTDPINVSCHGPTRPLGLVYSEDVVSGIQKILQHGKKTFGESFNLAFTETPTLVEYAILVGRTLGYNNLSFNVLPGKSPRDFHFPSVTFGPVVNTKARVVLGWEPTPLAEAVRVTCLWFEKAYFRYPHKVPLDHLSEESAQKLKEKYKKRQEQNSDFAGS